MLMYKSKAKVIFKSKSGNSNQIQSKMDEINQKRSETQPITEKTGGSTFANPDGHKAWKLIDEAGLRGYAVGGASMSQKHCNFMINVVIVLYSIKYGI